jgi:hypothetical protein
MPTHTHTHRPTSAAAAIVIPLIASGCSLNSGADRRPQPLPSPRIADGVTVNSDPTHAHAVPASGPVEQGVLYRFHFGSHCGIHFWNAWDFDGSFWDAVAGTRQPSLDEMSGPVDHGTIELTGPDRARYRSSGGVTTELERSPDQEREGMLCI